MGAGRVRDQQQESGPQPEPGDTTVQAGAAAFAWQAAVVGLATMILSVGDDTYGVGFGGGPAAVGLLCMCGVGPLVLAVAGWAHAGAYTLPVTAAARVTARRLPGPEWAWTAVGLAVLGAVYAAGLAFLVGSFLVAWPWTVASGVLPALSAAYWHRRSGSSPQPKIWRRTSLVGLGAVGAVLVLGVTALLTGVIEEYEPPDLTEQQLMGVWKGRDDGTVLHLQPGGRAVLEAVPYEGDDYFDTYALERCTGGGTWQRGEDGFNSGRIAVELDTADCGELAWTVGGTEEAPELFALFGDADSGDVHILDKQ
ncbi:hypothetical protein [Streptomyces sp. NPDC002889]|uniref:hypothetical protein n=1 Tax=Streptomyces sp. NPDC002889 TaxID=3364669 RepID=UPI00367DECD3